jgi:predicted dienelactone hydrolase
VAAALGLVSVMALVVGACSSGGSSGSKDSSSTTATAAPVDYSGPGPYPVGTAKLSLADGQAVYLYYPADSARLGEGTPVTGYSSADAFPDAFKALAPEKLVQQIPLDVTLGAPVANGPFPLLLFSHGFASYPEYSAGHLAHLASWGYFTAAPDHPSRNLTAVFSGTVVQGEADVDDLRRTLQLMRTEAEPGGTYADAIDFDRIAAEGHSAGGGAAAQLLNDPEIKTFIGLAPASPLDLSSSGGIDDAALAIAYAGATPPRKPSMIIAGERDGIIPLASITAEFDWLAPPKRFAVLANVGHDAFLDICAPIKAQGGLRQFTSAFPFLELIVRLAEDGCVEGYANPASTYRVIDHLVVAQLQWVFGLAPTDASLTPEYVESLFPGALSRYDFEGSTAAGQG